MSEVYRRTVLVRMGEYSVALATVSRETAERVYAEGEGFYGKFVRRDEVLKWDATEKDLARAKSALAERDRRIKEARAWCERTLREIGASREES